MSTNLTFYNAKGKPIYLGAELGGGGEGKIYQVKECRELVAKVYHKPPAMEQAAKLQAMIQLSAEPLTRVSAWPTDLLFAEKNRVGGFLMPKISGYKEIHKLYGPKTRLREFLHTDWAFLVHTAGNLARAFANIHRFGQVIGDVNHSNIVVANNGMVKLIDCDSFQITGGGKNYSCDVGVMTHQPPEFQSKYSLRGLVRSQNHDNFGLAVLIFQLLFMGRHPFSGQYMGVGEMPLERAIREYRFAYGKNAAAKFMKQPPGTLRLSALPERISSLFEQAFSFESANGTRPQSQEWVAALTVLSKQLQRCSVHSHHMYYARLTACPWCEIEHKLIRDNLLRRRFI